MTEIPTWAFDGIDKLINETSNNYPNRTRLAFAAYFAAHEEAPTSPLLIEAREIVATLEDSGGYPGAARITRAGGCDDSQDVKTALSALRRGMELAKESAS